MKNEDATSPSVSGPSEETTNKAPFEIRTAPGNELLLSLLMKDVEALKVLIQADRKNSSQGWTSNPALLAVLGFVLTVLVGNVVTAYLTYRQQERAAERSFIDESNKLRIQKIGEVWEQLDQDEYTIDQLLDADEVVVAKFPTPNDRAKEIERIVQTDRAKVSKYRFWLGQDISDRVNNYLDTNIAYSIRKLSGTPEQDLEGAKNARDTAKSNVDQVREELLRGIPK